MASVRKKDSQIKKQSVQEEAYRCEAAKILIVDDEPMTRTLLLEEAQKRGLTLSGSIEIEGIGGGACGCEPSLFFFPLSSSSSSLSFGLKVLISG